ncbi:hypothetical protein [Bradyrhizobium erythrophlei]|uniref:hypothetical protein n=1 Tax=Bradyrhizobium erythrophlei TaxID=1437360 RepID=UPI0009350AF9|nr:hypothetical protein [Bradyrhizobium erythrophlei]
MIDSSAGLFGLSEPMMRQGHAAEAVVSSGKIQKDGKWFPAGSRSNTNVQQQSGSLGKTGKVPVTYAKGWTPS